LLPSQLYLLCRSSHSLHSPAAADKLSRRGQERLMLDEIKRGPAVSDSGYMFCS